MDVAALHQPLNDLVKAYCSKPFQFWRAQHDRGEDIHDYAEGDPGVAGWWQAHTTVLEIETFDDGRAYAHVAVVIYSADVHTSPPAPSAAFLSFEDGSVLGNWADGAEFHANQTSDGVMPPNTSLERSRDV